MQDWERAALEFVESWRDDPNIVGALLAGSYVTGAPSRRSDLDLVLVLAAGTEWRERGSRVVRGYLVEYFANSPRQYRAYFRNDHAQWRRNTATMFLTGRILHDPRGHVQRLRVQAERWSKRPLPRLTRADLAAARYQLWDMLDNLRDLHERRSPALGHAYQHFVQLVYEVYTRFLRAPVVPAYQLHGYLTSARARAKYRLGPYPDARFAALLRRALLADGPDVMRRSAERLCVNALEAMGGFEVDGFRLRTPSRAQGPV
jgi:hypothetical protein